MNRHARKARLRVARTPFGRSGSTLAIVAAGWTWLGTTDLSAAPPQAASQVEIRTSQSEPLVRLPNTQPRRNFAERQVAAFLQPTAPAPPGNLPEPIPSGGEDAALEATLDGTSLDELSVAALANSPLVREAENQAVAARARAYQASLYPNPIVGTQAPQLAGNQSQYNAYMIQDIVTKGKIRLDTAAAQRAAGEAELSLVRARFDVLTMVRQRFYTSLAAQKRVEVLQAMVAIARASTVIGRRLLEAQVGSKGDVLLLEIEESRAEAELQNANTLAQTTKRQLAAATGMIDLPIARVKGDLKEALPDYELLAVQQGVLMRNALVQSAQIEVGRNELLLRRAQVEPFPNVNMMGGYQNQLPGAQAPENQAIYQVQMIVPLWNRNQGNIRAAQANIATSVAQLNRVQTELANTTAESLGRYLTAQQLADRYEKEILPNAVQLQRISSQLYRQGQIDFLRYLASQRALLDANLSYITAQESRWVAAAEVAGLLQSERFP